MQKNSRSPILRNALVGIAATLALTSLPAQASDAKDYPSSPIRIVVPVCSGWPS